MRNFIFLISKGRNLFKTLIYLKYHYIYIVENLYSSRKLFYKTNLKNLYILIIKNSDLIFYINNNFVDFSFFGKDLFYEFKINIFYKLYNLYFDKFNLSLIINKCFIKKINSYLVVFTKYINISRNFFNYINIKINLLNINSSSELILLFKKSDIIVDVVSSGLTVKNNNLFCIFNLLQLNNLLLLNLKLLYSKFFLYLIKKIYILFNVVFCSK